MPRSRKWSIGSVHGPLRATSPPDLSVKLPSGTRQMTLKPWRTGLLSAPIPTVCLDTSKQPSNSGRLINQTPAAIGCTKLDWGRRRIVPSRLMLGQSSITTRQAPLPGHSPLLTKRNELRCWSKCQVDSTALIRGGSWKRLKRLRFRKLIAWRLWRRSRNGPRSASGGGLSLEPIVLVWWFFSEVMFKAALVSQDGDTASDGRECF